MVTKEIEVNVCTDEIFLQADSCGYIFYYQWIHSPDKMKFMEKIILENFQHDCACGRKLSDGYLYIIYSLKEAGLLHKSYRMMCCFCHILACIGLEIPKEWGDVEVTDYSDDPEEEGITILEINAIYKPTTQLFELLIRIHNAEKFTKTGRMIEDVKFVSRMWQ